MRFTVHFIGLYFFRESSNKSEAEVGLVRAPIHNSYYIIYIHTVLKQSAEAAK